MFDSHFHLNHPLFSGIEASTWQEAGQFGITEGTIIGYDLESSQKALQLAEQLPGLYAAVGVSPHDILQAPADYIEQLQRLAQHSKCVAIGEIGLEYHHPVGSKEIQQEQFIRQIRLADSLQRIVVIHLRDADEDFLRILHPQPPRSAVLHCFTASDAVLHAAVELGYFISFSGMITFKNAHSLRKAAAQTPEDQLLIETDAPYLAPVPYRGKTCTPKMMIETAKVLAEIRNTTPEKIGNLTERNAKRAFGLEGS